jgi:hypothetical protein
MRATYDPLFTLKPVAEDVWVVDGPVIRYGMPWPKIPFPTRTTIIRLPEGRLFVHSPTKLTAGLLDAIDRIGRPAWIIGPNRIHYWWIPDWTAAWPEAVVYLAPRIPEQAGDRIRGPFRPLDGAGPSPWDGVLDIMPVGYAADFSPQPRRAQIGGRDHDRPGTRAGDPGPWPLVRNRRDGAARAVLFMAAVLTLRVSATPWKGAGTIHEQPHHDREFIAE